jgi:hypothetical protein
MDWVLHPPPGSADSRQAALLNAEVSETFRLSPSVLNVHQVSMRSPSTSLK